MSSAQISNQGTFAVVGLVQIGTGPILTTSTGTVALSGGNPSNAVGLSARYDTAPGSVTNNGAITIASDGPAEIDDYTGGTGTITVTGNTLTLRPPAGNATTTLGNITVAASATLALDAASNNVTTGGGAFILPAGKSITGAGTLSVGAPICCSVDVTLNGTDALPGLVADLTSTQFVLNTALSLTSLSVQTSNGATVTGTGAITLTSGTGTLNGNLATSGLFTIASGATLNWTGGTMRGSGTTVIAHGATLNSGVPGTNDLVDEQRQDLQPGHVRRGRLGPDRHRHDPHHLDRDRGPERRQRVQRGGFVGPL